jgi:hypothetical protein
LGCDPEKQAGSGKKERLTKGVAQELFQNPMPFSFQTEALF